MSSVSEKFATRFSNQFEILNADSEALRENVYQVRHRVFCQELGFAMQSQGEFETNEYDNHSLHILVRDRMTNTGVACMRVVEPLPSSGGLPFESFGLRHIDRKLFDWKKLDSARCCELSRLAVLENIRRPLNNGSTVTDLKKTALDRDVRAFLPISLLYAAFSLVLARDYEWIFMGAEPRLQRLVSRYGINVQQISPLFEYYGQRALFVLNRNDLLADMQKWRRDWFEVFENIDHALSGREIDMIPALAS